MQVSEWDNIQESRLANGSPSLLPHVALNEEAQRRAEILASEGRIYHSPSLAAGVPDGWWLVGENVGVGADIDVIHEAFMESPSHRENILRPGWDWVGVGVAIGPDGRTFVVHVFADYDPVNYGLLPGNGDF